MGYAGGTKPDPTYHDLGDHTETVQIDFDPGQVSYTQLLDIFWHNHCPHVSVGNRQYASIIFLHGDGQNHTAESYVEQETAASGKKIYTELMPYNGFYLAEGYHQKYYLQLSRELFAEFGKYYTDIWELVGSTAAARVNGYIKGTGTVEELMKEIDSFGLSDKGKKRLIQIAESY